LAGFGVTTEAILTNATVFQSSALGAHNVKIVSHLIGNGYRMDAWDIRERDIDLLLIEEFYASPPFRQHFWRLQLWSRDDGLA